jgi:very-short-patch-repair endonuclease
MTARAPSVSTSLARWRDNLIDLTRRNPLLTLRPTQSTFLVISRPGAQAVFDRLVVAGKPWAFWLPPLDEDDEDHSEAMPPTLDLDRLDLRDNELLCADLGRRRLLRVLTNLYRRSEADYRERGLHILYVACGLLEWRDQENTETFRSPLVLVPVELARTSLREPFSLAPADEDPLLNPALQARLLQDFDFRLPAIPEDWEEKTLTAYLDEVEASVRGLPGWRVERGAVLTLFSFFKGVIHQDLGENEARVKAHPLVRALAGEAVGDVLNREPLPDDRELDAVEPPEKIFHILDADSSQRLCLEAAAKGHSFVLHGPPGTGKSQTIANLIADCLAGGKKVLFVSEKMAALEVVYKRLRAVGLGDFCLELHSHKASKREVVAELRRCLEERRPPAADGEADFEKLSQRREQLNRYAEALHTPREPLRRTAWWALGELARVAGAPAVPLGPVNPAEISSVWLEDSRQAVGRLQQLWHVQEQGQDFPWWGFKAGERYTLKLRDEVNGLLEKVRARLEKLATVAGDFGRKIGARGPVPWLLRAGELLDASPRPPAHWLTAPDLPQLTADLERCAGEYQQRARGREPLTARYGESVWALPEGTAAKVDQAWHAAAPLLAPGDEKGAALLTRAQALRGWAADTQRRLPGWIADARTLEKWLDVRLPLGAGGSGAGGKDDPSPLGLRRLQRLANLCMTDTPPEKAWVTDPQALEAARALVTAARPQFADYHARRAKLLQIYTEKFFEDLDIPYLARQFRGPYARWTRFFSLQYRRDRRAIARRSRTDLMPATIWKDIVEAEDLLQLRARLEAEGPARKAVLGRYEKGLTTDCDAAERGTRVAADAIEVARDLDCAELPQKLVEALSGGNPATEKIRAAAKRLHDSLGPWLHTTEELRAALPADHLPGSAAPLEESALSVLNQYAKDLQASLNQFGSLTDPVLARAKSPPPDAVTLVEDLKQAERMAALEASEERDAQKWAERFGPAFRGVATDWNALRKALSWVVRVRELFANQQADAGRSPALPSPEFIQLAGAGPIAGGAAREVRQAQEQLEQALHGLEVRFEPPAPLFQGKKLIELPLDTLRQRLAALKDRVGELADWIDLRQLRSRFEHLGLGVFWEGLQKDKPPREQMPDVFLRAALTAWVEHVFQEDPALGQFRRQEHERVVEEFRELDRKLIRLNAERVGRLADAQRPQAPQAIPGSEVALLMREAHKKARHLPIRRLFEEMPSLLLQLKPCLLMSPLSVSQFLHPEKIHFDLVVFDEASQILPEDAIGAIYRGDQVIVTGDDRQLPPTTFFQQLAEEDDESDEEAPPAFESVLDASLGAGLRPHMLRWHYRSRHEALIAYSNLSFYDSKLVTFPAARESGAALGVHFRHVPDGVYDRGGRRDNRREAEVVADLVLAHVREHGAGKTLGVIAFSQAQMNVIEDELESRLLELPELEPFFKADRLEGFFVKNLETVQGDERDVILLSVGYGRDAQGRLTMNFGPLNREGGERRLNVAVTRAREKLLVVSSLRAQDIDLGATKAAGALHLHRYLDYAERGAAALELTQPQGAGEPASPLEADVAAELRRLGYEVTPQVGCSGYRIDLGVRDPAAPGSFLLAVECDGATYHSAATARDRDRLRQYVLEQLGWRVHRIWSPDWIYRRADEVERLRRVLASPQVATCGLAPKPKPPPVEPPAPPPAVTKIEVAPATAGPVTGTVPYRLCTLKVAKEVAKAEMHAPRARKELCRLLTELVEAEGPVHLETAVRRLRQAWKAHRAGERARKAIEEAAADCAGKGQLRRQGDFLYPAAEREVAVRVPDPKDRATERAIEHIAPEELQAGMRLLLRQGGGLGEEALLAQTARLFGFAKIGDNLRRRLQESLEELHKQDAVSPR